MKKMLCFLCVLCIWAAPSFAAVQSFLDFSVDIPPGWSTEDNEGLGLALIAEDGSAAIVISQERLYTPTGEQVEEEADTRTALAEAAQAFARNIPGAVLTEVKGRYDLNFPVPHGGQGEIRLMGRKNLMVMIVINNHKGNSQVKAIADSVKF